MKNPIMASDTPLRRQDDEHYQNALNFSTWNLVKEKNATKLLETQLFLTFMLDLVLLNSSILISLRLSCIRQGIEFPTVNELMPFLIAFNFIWFFVSTFTNVYDIFEGLRLNLSLKTLLWTTLICFGLISLVYYPFFYEDFQVHFLISSFLPFTAATMIIHMIIRSKADKRASTMTYAIVGGNQKTVKHLKDVFHNSYGNKAICVGRFADNDIPNAATIGSFHDIERFIRQHQVSKLLYFYSDLSREEIQKIIQVCRSQFITFEVIPTSFDLFKKGVQVEQINNLPVFRRKKEPLCLLKNRLLKRIFDIIFSLMVILLIFPWLFPIIALLIKMESRGPVFFSQYRSGYWNKPFMCMKFRSMRVNESSDKKQATRGDIRITKIGSFLRKTNLDELPQFFNVLIGDMSVVGPRPHMLQHTSDYSKLIDSYMIRHEVKPGITGWAQVNGWRGPTIEVFKMAKRVEFDVFYIENWSFWLDCKCVFLTVFNMVRGEKNAF